MNGKESAEQTDEDNKSQLTFSQAEARVHLPHNNTGGRILLSKLKNGFFLKSSSSEVDFENLP